jgi:hypothetical protein
MSAIVKDSFLLWELRLFDGALWSNLHPTAGRTLNAVIQCCTAGSRRLAPLAPPAFNRRLRDGVADGTIKFTAGADLEEVVLPNYEAGFLASLCAVEQLLYFNLEWTDVEAVQLADALSYAHEQAGHNLSITRVWLAGNSIGDVGAAALAAALARGVLAHCLTELDLEHNSLTAAGKQALKDACAQHRVTCNV